MRGQETGHGQGIVAVALHAQGQGLDAAQGQEAVLRSRHGTGRVLHQPEPGGQLLVVGTDHAEDHVRVAGQVFGGRVHDDVDAGIARVLQVRRGKRVVDGRGHAAGAADGGHARQIHQLEQRIGGGLQPDQPGALANGVFQLFRPGGQVQERHRHAGRGMDPGQQPVGTAVAVGHCDHFVAGCQRGTQHGINGSHAAAESQPVLHAFQRRHIGFQRRTGRIGRTRIGVRLLVAQPVVAENRGLVHRRHDRVRCRVTFIAGMDGASGKLHNGTPARRSGPAG